MKVLKFFGPIIGVVLAYSFANYAAPPAQNFVADERTQTAQEEGWEAGINVGLSGNWDYNRNAVGVDTGDYLAIGGALKLHANMLDGNHEWLNQFSLAEAFSKTPVIPQLLKATDDLMLKTGYYYHIPGVEWLGPFAEADVNTAIFESYDVAATDQQYSLDGSTTATTAKFYKLAGVFGRVYLNQDVGFFADALREKSASWRWLASWHMLEAFQDNTFTVAAKDAAKNTVAIKSAKSFINMGPQVATLFKGTSVNGSLSYYAGASAMLPLVSMPQAKARTFQDSLNLKFGAGLSYKMVEGLGVEWRFLVTRIPDISEKFQVQNGILFTYSYESAIS